MSNNLDAIDTPFSEKRAYWQSKIQQWENGELNQPDFCKQNNLSFSTFQYWRGLLKQQKTKPVEFKPVTVKQQKLALPSSSENDLQLQIKTEHATINIYRNSAPNLVILVLKSVGLSC